MAYGVIRPTAVLPALAGVALAAAPPARADAPMPLEPAKLAIIEPESVYAPPAPTASDEGTNAGGVNLDLSFKYLTADMYRGVNHSNVGGPADAPNLQFDEKLEFNLGRYPHPFFGLFTNVYDSDPVSRFQEIRPYVGLELTARPFTFAAGHTNYIYPERESNNSAEVWLRLTLDDSHIFHTERPLLQPYILAAYDYDQNKGCYFELGVRHEIPIEQTGLTLAFVADIGYIQGIQKQFIFSSPNDIGFQHYEVGLTGSYSLNTLLNLPRRFGQWSFEGYLYYTDGINNNVLADTKLWGGAGLTFHY